MEESNGAFPINWVNILAPTPQFCTGAPNIFLWAVTRSHFGCTFLLELTSYSDDTSSLSLFELFSSSTEDTSQSELSSGE